MLIEAPHLILSQDFVAQQRTEDNRLEARSTGDVNHTTNHSMKASVTGLTLPLILAGIGFLFLVFCAQIAWQSRHHLRRKCKSLLCVFRAVHLFKPQLICMS